MCDKSSSILILIRRNLRGQWAFQKINKNNHDKKKTKNKKKSKRCQE